MALLVEYHEELEIDLHRQGVDLLDVWRGTLSLRRLELMVRHLPAKSLLVRELAPEVAAQADWSPEGYLIADLFDAFARANFKDPKPYPRPAEQVRQRQRAEARRSALEAQRERAKTQMKQLEGRT